MTTQSVDTLARVAADIVMKGAIHYLQAHNLKPISNDALAECCQSWAKIKLPEALADAKEAFECNMSQAGVTTFALSMMQAGIEAAKECSDVSDLTPEQAKTL